MRKKMSLSARRELLSSLKPEYRRASADERKRLLEGFVTATGYNRKHAITLLGRFDEVGRKKGKRKVIYDDGVKEALVKLWNAANRICSKRLVPFLPQLTEALERFGHLQLTEVDRGKLLSMSAATVDRLLKPDRQRLGGGKSTTKPGNILRKQIPIRTFADWNDVVPGFLEGDLVAHCGGNIRGRFCHTLTLTDIVTTWTECAALPAKTDNSVVAAMENIQKCLPFPVLGLDTDNGSEFINYELADWCADRGITFTRAREYRKNDQAHVEEKNGSVVRRLTGYNRFEGDQACSALGQLYEAARLYINFFQPSVKLVKKVRDEGRRLQKTYDKAKTPFQRVLDSPQISKSSKNKLTKQYQTLDPVKLLAEIEKRQETLWHTANAPLEEPAPESPAEGDSAVSANSTKQPAVRKRGRPRKAVAKLKAVKKPRPQTGKLGELGDLIDDEISHLLAERLCKYLPF
jgi:hypothetical protein